VAEAPVLIGKFKDNVSYDADISPCSVDHRTVTFEALPHKSKVN
jgi:hypothetical protein